MVLSEDTRQALIERVQRKVAGRGIARRTVEAAVARVAEALASQDATPTAPESPEQLIAVFASTTFPDLLSRVRAALDAEGIASTAASAQSGRHTVVTVRVPASARDHLLAIAHRLGASLTLQPDSSVTVPA
jgi:hypothetical protein